MDTLEDIACYKIEAKILRDRAPEPCDDYYRSARAMPQCANCGWCHEEDDADLDAVRLTVYLRGRRAISGTYDRLGAALRLRFSRHLEDFMGYQTEAV